MNAPFAPVRADQIAEWARAHRTEEAVARRRFAQAAAGYVIAGDPELAGELRLFGSAALSLLYGGRRTARDLDFWCRPAFAPDYAARREVFARVQRRLNEGLRALVPFDDPAWRAALAGEVKVRLCARARLEVGFVP